MKIHVNEETAFKLARQLMNELQPAHPKFTEKLGELIQILIAIEWERKSAEGLF